MLYVYKYICTLYFFIISLSIFVEGRHKIPIMGRSQFKEISAHEFAQIVKNQDVYKLRGGGLEDINIFRSKRRYIQGGGLLSTFANLSKLLLPAIKRHVLPAAANFASGVVQDVSAGRNLKESIRQRGKKNLKEMGSKILSGRGLKRKRASVSSVVNKRAKRRKEPAANKKQGRGLKKKVRKSRPKNKKSNKKKRGEGRYHDIFS